MVDYYEVKNDYVNVLKYVIKVFELSGENKYKDRMKEFKGKN